MSDDDIEDHASSNIRYSNNSSDDSDTELIAQAVRPHIFAVISILGSRLADALTGRFAEQVTSVTMALCGFISIVKNAINGAHPQVILCC